MHNSSRDKTEQEQRARQPRITVLKTRRQDDPKEPEEPDESEESEESRKTQNGKAKRKPKDKSWEHKRDTTWWTAIAAVPLQLLIAAIPVMLSRRNWTILLVTTMGTILAILTSSMVQWRKEKFACRKDSKAGYIITRGNGHSHVFMILYGRLSGKTSSGSKKQSPKGISLNLEDLAVPTLPTSTKTKVSTVLLAMCWTFLLVTVAGLKRDAWFLLGVGLVGMVQNVYAVTMERGPDGNGVFLSEPI